jgi:glycosyltransferase involved in cell wall biosynthesis
LRGSSLRRKYLFFCPWPVAAGSGVNNVIVGLSEAMRERYEPEVVVTGWQQPAADQVWLKMRAPELRPSHLVGFALHLIPNLLRLLRLGHGAAAINAHFAELQNVPLVLLRKLRLIPKVILSVHGADVREAAVAAGSQRAIYRWLFENADAVVACSDALASEVSANYPKAKVASVWNGVSEPPETFGERPLVEPYLVSVAAFVQKKGHDVLLRAFQQIALRFPQLQLVLIGGEGPERAAVESLIHELNLEGRVRMLVNVPHEAVWTWLYHAECFVHAAREEPFGIALLEAALVHTPVVATAVGGIQEYFLNEVHGLACKPNEPDRLAASIGDMLADRAGARRRAHAFYEQARRFTWGSAWDRYCAIAGLA